jgi:hypothetical protein
MHSAARLGDRFAQHLFQGVANAVVADARRGEQKFHAGFLSHPMRERDPSFPVMLFRTFISSKGTSETTTWQDFLGGK